MSITTRISVATGTLVVLAVAAVSLFAALKMQSALEAAERQQLEQTYKTLLADIDAEGRRGESLSALVADLPPIQKSFAAGDRNGLHAMVGGAFEDLKKNYGVRQFHFHTPPATSFLRLHKPEKFGDDMSAERLTVVDVNRKLASVHGLETGAGGLGVRGMVPVKYADRHLGSVEFGMAFDQTFFDEFKARHGIDVALLLNQNGTFETFGSTFGKSELLNDAQKGRVMQGEAVSFAASLGAKPVAVYANVVKDYSGKAIGVIEIAADRTFFVTTMRNTQRAVFLIGALALAIGVGLAMILARGICRPLRMVAASMECLADGEGDLSVRLPEMGHNEVGRVAAGFNRYTERINKAVEKVAEAGGQLADAVSGLYSAAEHTRRDMRKQQSENDQIATAMNEMSATVHEVANNTAKAAGAASDADTQASKGREVVQRSIQSIQMLAEEVERVAQVIARVDAESTSIGSVLDVIGAVAEQTNLLALNAAIEAARAGDQGRGFAVVADEVRTLAHRTQQSTGEIRAMIERLQSSAKEAVQVMERGRERTRESVDEAAGAGKALTGIAQSVDVISQMNSQIATASEEQSAVADEINRNVQHISEEAEHATEESKHAAEYSVRLVQLAQDLMDLVRQFKLGDRDLLSDLDRAKTAHLAWRVKLRKFLDGEQALSESQAVSDHECAFGQWYFGEGLKNFSTIPEMAQIREPHAQMHQLIKRIIELKNHGKSPEAEAEYVKVEPLSEAIVELLDKIKNQLRDLAAKKH